MIETERLKLVPANVALARAEISDRHLFACLLGASVPESWPPESLADALPLFLSLLEANPESVGWFGWYALSRIDGDLPTLIGSGGFLGPPRDGTVQIGYSVLNEFQRQGYATEIAGCLVRWAFSQAGVVTIAAETEWANPASVRVLEKAGFLQSGLATVSGGKRFELHNAG